MKVLRSIASLLVTSTSAGVAVITLGGYLPADLGFAALTVLGLTAFALSDYARPRHSLQVAARVLRPSMPSASTRPVAYPLNRAA